MNKPKTFNKAVRNFSNAVKDILPFIKDAKIKMDIAEIIESVYKDNSIEFMFDSESIKGDLIEKIAEYIESNYTMRVQTPVEKLKPNYTDLEEHTAYLVKVKLSANNVEHDAILWTGLHTGAYWEIFNNSYDSSQSFDKAYSVKVIKKLHKFK
jgi:hypothetical protein